MLCKVSLKCNFLRHGTSSDISASAYCGAGLSVGGCVPEVVITVMSKS